MLYLDFQKTWPILFGGFHIIDKGGELGRQIAGRSIVLSGGTVQRVEDGGTVQSVEDGALINGKKKTST